MSDRNNVTGCQNGSCSSRILNVKVYQMLIFAMPALFSLVLILLFWLLYMRRRRTAQAASLLRAQFFTRSLFSRSMDRGLRKSFRDRLPVIVYDDHGVAKEQNSQCPVCLGDYEPNEKLRQLPNCGHCYHVACIDEWLISNSTCPVCRSLLLPTKKVVPINFPGDQAVVITGACATESVSSIVPVICDGANVRSSQILNGESSHNNSPCKESIKQLVT